VSRNSKLVAVVVMTVVGAVLHEPFLFWAGVACLGLVMLIRLQDHLPGSQLTSSFFLLALVGLGCLAAAAYTVIAAGFSLAAIIAVGLVLPASYFLLLATAVGYFLVTGRRPPWADSVDNFFGRLNRRLHRPIGRG
jgi:hypothetical protein